MDGDSTEFTDIVFTYVLAYRLENVLEGNILFDVEEANPNEVVDEEAQLFRESWRHGWPSIDYRGDLTALKNELEARSIRAYRISSSYGMFGWVLAKRCERMLADGPYIHSRN
jgi:hypothetical protein